jgi:hypothetical protein
VYEEPKFLLICSRDATFYDKIPQPLRYGFNKEISVDELYKK